MDVPPNHRPNGTSWAWVPLLVEVEVEVEGKKLRLDDDRSNSRLVRLDRLARSMMIQQMDLVVSDGCRFASGRGQTRVGGFPKFWDGDSRESENSNEIISTCIPAARPR